MRNFHRNTLKALAEFAQLHAFLKPGELLGESIGSALYARMWRMARAESFEAATDLSVLESARAS